MAKDDLISRETLLAAYDAAHVGPPGGARKLIAEAPAVDAAPVVHGRWQEYHAKARGYGKVYYQHSCTPLLYESPYYHCPYCGAKMDPKPPACGPDYCEIGGHDHG